MDTAAHDPATGRVTVPVLSADPALGAGLSSEALENAMREANAPLLCVDVGDWNWEPEHADSPCHLGLLVLDGLLARSETVGRLEYPELLGSGDVLRPWIDGPYAGSAQARWKVLAPTRFAVLDEEFALRVQPWPQIASVLLERAVIRSRSLSASLAIHRAVRVQDRVKLMLWHLATRWGMPTSEGTLLPIPLTHDSIAQLVGSRRPPVTTAVKQLQREGILRRTADKGWLLTGELVVQAP